MRNRPEVRQRIAESLQRCGDYAQRDPDLKGRGQRLKRAQLAAQNRLAALAPSGNEQAEERARLIGHTQRFAKPVSVEEADAIPGSPTVRIVGKIRGSSIPVKFAGITRMVRPSATVIEDGRTGTQLFLAGRQPQNLSLDQLKRVDQGRFPNARAALASHASQLRRRSGLPGR